jgi:hypothetical protein
MIIWKGVFRYASWTHGNKSKVGKWDVTTWNISFHNILFVDQLVPLTCTTKKWKNKVTLPTTGAFQGNPKRYVGFHYLESFKTSRPADGKELCLCSWRSTVPVPKHHIQSWSYDDRQRWAVAFQVATTACSTCLNAITTISWMNRGLNMGQFLCQLCLWNVRGLKDLATQQNILRNGWASTQIISPQKV